jgi:hypothetical protein
LNIGDGGTTGASCVFGGDVVHADGCTERCKTHGAL